MSLFSSSKKTDVYFLPVTCQHFRTGKSITTCLIFHILVFVPRIENWHSSGSHDCFPSGVL